MRSSIRWTSLALILAGAWGFSRPHAAGCRAPCARARRAAAEAALGDDPALRGVRVRLDHLDATLAGTADTPATRAEAVRRVRGVWGVRVRRNEIVVPARLDALVEIDNEPSADAKPDRTVSLVGILPESARALDLPGALSGALRGRGFAAPRSRVDYRAFAGPLPDFDRAALATLAVEFSELPGIGRLELNGEGIRLEGEAFPGMKARLEALAAQRARR